MDYIINPIWFYLFQFIDGIRVLTIVATIVLAIASAFILTYVYSATAESGLCYDNNKRRTSLLKSRDKWIKYLKRTVIWFCILLVLAVMIPTQETILRMMLANFATEDNVSLVFNKIIEGAQYIIDKIAPVAETVAPVVNQGDNSPFYKVRRSTSNLIT